MTFWAPETAEKAACLWKAGLAASLIAEQVEKTRNSVMGKIFRMGLRNNARPPESRVRKKPVFKPREAKPVAQKAAFVPVPEDPELITDPDRIHPDDAAIPMKQRRQIWELTSKMCKFPVGRPGTSDFFCCGGKPLEGYIYCRSHAERSYRAADPISLVGVR